MTKTIVVLLDDAAHAQDRLAPLLDAAPDALWVLVACAPRMTHRASKWVSHGSREHWRTKWAARLYGQMQPWLDAHALRAELRLAKGPVQELLQAVAPDEVIDVRRPKLAGAMPAAQHEEEAERAPGLRLPPVLALGMGVWIAAVEA